MWFYNYIGYRDSRTDPSYRNQSLLICKDRHLI